MYKYLAMIMIAMMFMMIACPEGHGWRGSDPWYAEDPRTGLCFAIIQGGGYTNVPCTPEVKQLIKNECKVACSFGFSKNGAVAQ